MFNRIFFKYFTLLMAVMLLMCGCSPVYEHLPETSAQGDSETAEPAEEYFTNGEVVCSSSANLGIVYEGQWVYVESTRVQDGDYFKTVADRIVKYNPVTDTVSSVCLNPTCMHSDENCMLCAPSGWLVSYFEIFGDWMMYSFSNFFAIEDDEYDVYRIYLYNLKTGESRHLYSNTKEGELITRTPAYYVMDGIIYATRLELDYTGEEEYNSNPHSKPFVPETHQFIEAYDPETGKTERLCEVPSDYFLSGISNKRFFFKDTEGVTWSSDYKGENLTEEKNMDFDFIMLCGKYVYPVESYDHSKSGYNIRAYDLEKDESFFINFGMQIKSLLLDSGKLCFITTSNIDEFKKFSKNETEYVKALYPDVTDREKLSELKTQIRNYLNYNCKTMVYITDLRGENKQLVFEKDNISFSPERIYGDYIFGSITYGDPNNNYQKMERDDDGRCVINLKTGEITSIPQLEYIPG